MGGRGFETQMGSSWTIIKFESLTLIFPIKKNKNLEFPLEKEEITQNTCVKVYQVCKKKREYGLLHHLNKNIKFAIFHYKNKDSLSYIRVHSH
jgi:hypothetical protein